MPDFNNKKIIIAPYTKITDAFKEKFCKQYPDAIIVGFLDKVQQGKDIYKIEHLGQLDFDYIFILSPNHFKAIYKDYAKCVSKSKLIKINIVNNTYHYLNSFDIFIEQFKQSGLFIKQSLFKYFSTVIDRLNIKRKYFVFISRDFINGNNKFLYLYAQKHKIKSVMLTNNKSQYQQLKNKGFNIFLLNNFIAYFYLSIAKNIIVDQGVNSLLLNLISKKQKTVQLWHGVPLEHMNLLTDINYDYFISTSDYVSNTSFNKVFLAKHFVATGYPRNDVFLKQQQSANDLIFTDESIYSLVKEKFATNEKIVVYMPTFRESDFGEKSTQFNSMPLEFDLLNEQLKAINTYMVIKLHPFVMVFYQEIIKNSLYSNILFHNIQGDIYPILKYTDILITDYSSVYADFLLLNRPIIFFIYDHGQCSKMAHGYLYAFDEVSPGEKAYNQNELINCIENINLGNDCYKKQRELLRDTFFEYCDSNASKRIISILEKE
ncbi:MAG: CDP-glycerol glycerophosphotransferase family protein [Pseudomonadota bacterium]